MLACKTGDETLAAKLYNHGSTKASSNANAGLILGIALFGDNARDLLKLVVWNMEWEADSCSTGNCRYTLIGM